MADEKMMNENMDITEESDVTEESVLYGDLTEDDLCESDDDDEVIESLVTPIVTPETEMEDRMTTDDFDEPPYTIHFTSMDGRTYLIDGNEIDWDALATEDSIKNLQENLQMAHQYERELMFAAHETTRPAILDTVYESVPEFMEKSFGFGTAYHDTYPDATEWDVAMMMCIDLTELLTIMLHEVELNLAEMDIDEVNKAHDWFKNISEEIEEEENNED